MSSDTFGHDSVSVIRSHFSLQVLLVGKLSLPVRELGKTSAAPKPLHVCTVMSTKGNVYIMTVITHLNVIDDII